MLDWVLDLPLFGMTAVILAITYAITAVIYTVVSRQAVGERARAFKAVSPGMLPPLSLVFALLVGFIAAQAWGDADKAHTAVNHEASALRQLVLLSRAFPEDKQTPVLEFVRAHIEHTVNDEWPAMSRHTATLGIVPTALADCMALVLAIEPQGAGQVAAQREMVVSLGTALDARRQRIILSESSINAVKWSVLIVEALLMLIAIALVHSDNNVTNRIILTIFSTAAAAAIILIAAHSRPFAGPLAVKPDVLLQVMPERAPGA